MENEQTSHAKFVAQLGHDLKTYLNPIIGFSSMIIQDVGALDPTQAKHLQMIYDSAQRLLERIDAFVEFQRLCADVLTLDADWFSPAELFLEVSAPFSEAAQRQGLRIEIKAETLPARIRLPRRLLLRIMKELTANAVKFTSQGSICLGGKSHEDAESGIRHLRFFVSDTGSGLTERLRAQLQTSLGSPARQENWQGLGLGLALVRESAVRLGAQVEIGQKTGAGLDMALPIELAEEHCQG